MLKNFSRKLSRKRLNSKTATTYQDLVVLRNVPSGSEGFAHSSSGWATPVAAENAPRDVSVSSAGFHAHDPQADQHVLQANGKHIFAAVFTQEKSTRGGLYLRQHLYSEFLAQLTRQKQSVPLALQAALDILNRDFQNLNPNTQHIMEGLDLAVAYMDFKAGLLHVASNGACRCVVGKRLRGGKLVQIIADTGLQDPKDATEISHISAVTTVRIMRNEVDTVILGSKGFWQEVEPSNALLRMQSYQDVAPKANSASAAAHLINYGLHCITERLRDSKDLRMSSLKSVNNLVSLQPGDRSQYKWGSKQPVRRRRGDVHKDLTAVAFQLHWEGRLNSFEGDSKKYRQAVEAGFGPTCLPPDSHWHLVRLHFREFPSRARQMAESNGGMQSKQIGQKA